MTADIRPVEQHQLTRLNQTAQTDECFIALFAHNEARNIHSALRSIERATQNLNAKVFILANGCTDQTVQQVHNFKGNIGNLYLMETAVGDKANTWNIFVHQLLADKSIPENSAIIFMDGDVTVSSSTFDLLQEMLNKNPYAEAAGAMPATGRDRDAWRQRMVFNGMLAGNCYALRGSFVSYLQQRQMRIPVGFIGEDFFVSWLIATNLWRNAYYENMGRRCVFHGRAEFSFRSLSPFRWRDCITYLRRKWRYTLRELQMQMLLNLINRGLLYIPPTVEELYKMAPMPSRFVWRGRETPMRTLAVYQIRKMRSSKSQ
ncbi:glycosyltransferase family A protein [Neptunicella marina]|uniref:Glycosyltransferase family 2 protein n=1 Tax=Neptunicella marina TaxID=2125989 RepID=A0A8J6ISN4_9ALTE|nr:glycosyltransferase family A protein [Neptunicella marina]MBC3765569.1 glycosyltransferase family 2 protein [Neptunicella marina]